MYWVRSLAFGWKGYWEFTQEGFTKAQAKFANANMLPMQNKTIVITGANSGLGYETARQFANMQAHVHMVCRSKDKGQEAQAKIQSESHNQHVYLHIADLSCMQQVQQVAVELKQQCAQVHVLINNAGVLPLKRETTKEGLDATFAANSLSQFVLTRELLPLLQQASSKSDMARVIFVSSGGMYTVPLDYGDVNFTKMDPFDGTTAYAQTKRQQVVLAKLFAKRYNNVYFASMHPGWVETPGVQNSLPSFYEKMKSSLRTTPQGVDTIMWLAMEKQVPEKHANGAFFFDRQAVDDHLTMAWTQESEQDREAFWSVCESTQAKVCKL